MDKFNKLPFVQKVAILVGVLAALAGLFYYAIITPEEEAMAEAVRKQRTEEEALAKLQKEAAAVKPEDLVKEKGELEAEKLQYQEMLPKTEELVKFISGLSETARAAGLDLMSFEKKAPTVMDFYLEVPISMSVRGTFRELIGFLRAVAEADRRVVNIRNLDLRTTNPDVGPYLAKYNQQRLDAMPRGWTARPLTETQIRMDKARAHDEMVAEGIPIDAKFDAVVFVHTGKELDEGSKAARAAVESVKTFKLKTSRTLPL